MAHYHVFDPSIVAPSTLRRKPIRAAYLGEGIRHFAVGLFAIFEPVYLYKLFDAHGYSPPAAFTLIFYVILFLCFPLLGVFIVRIIPRFGFSKLVVVSTVFLAAHYAFLFVAQEVVWLVWLAVVCSIIRSALFWPAYHLFFSRASNLKHRGGATANIEVFRAFLGALSPALGGLLIVWFGFPALFIVVLLLLFLSVLPYLLIELRDGHHGGFGPVFSELREVGAKGAAVSFIGEGIETASAAYIWPLVLFLLAFNFTEIGLLASFVTILAIIAAFLIGQASDRRNRIVLLLLGTPLAALSWAFRAFAGTPITAIAANAFSGITRPLALIPYNALFYDRVSLASQHRQMHVVLFREIMLNCIGRSGFLAACAVLLMYGVSLSALLLIAIPGALAMSFIAPWASPAEVGLRKGTELGIDHPGSVNETPS